MSEDDEEDLRQAGEAPAVATEAASSSSAATSSEAELDADSVSFGGINLMQAVHSEKLPCKLHGNCKYERDNCV